NRTHSGSGTLTVAGHTLAVGGALVNSAGTIDANGQVVTVTGLTTLSGGTYVAGSATQNFNGGLKVSGGTFTGDGGTVNASNVGLTSGTLNAPSTLNVSGNWSVTGGTFNPGTGTVAFTAASGTQTLNSGNQAFNNLSHTGTGTLQLVTNPLTVNDNLTNSAGTFDANGQSVTVTGLTSVSG